MNELLSSLFDQNTKAEPSDEEYVGEDGLFYCKKCHTPTQCRVEIAGRQSIVSCMCKCAKEDLEKYERELAEMNRRNHIYSLKANGIQERALYDWTFEKAVDSPSIQMARRYVDSWPEVKKNNLGLLLWGDVGTGKSFTAACIANALLETGVPVLMTNFSKILNHDVFYEGYFSQTRKYIMTEAHLWRMDNSYEMGGDDPRITITATANKFDTKGASYGHHLHKMRGLLHPQYYTL